MLCILESSYMYNNCSNYLNIYIFVMLFQFIQIFKKNPVHCKTCRDVDDPIHCVLPVHVYTGVSFINVCTLPVYHSTIICVIITSCYTCTCIMPFSVFDMFYLLTSAKITLCKMYMWLLELKKTVPFQIK
jgi:hypothetical protein